MSIEIYRIFSIISAVLSVTCLIVTFILFFKLKIPYVISDLRGNLKNANIRKREQENEEKNKNYSENKQNKDNAELISNNNQINVYEDDLVTKPLTPQFNNFDNFKVIKSVVFVNTKEEISI